VQPALPGTFREPSASSLMSSCAQVHRWHTANTFGRPRADGHRLAIAARILSGLFQAHTLFHSRAHRFSEQQIILLSLSGWRARLAYGTPDSSAFWLAFGVVWGCRVCVIVGACDVYGDRQSKNNRPQRIDGEARTK